MITFPAVCALNITGASAVPEASNSISALAQLPFCNTIISPGKVFLLALRNSSMFFTVTCFAVSWQVNNTYNGSSNNFFILLFYIFLNWIAERGFPYAKFCFEYLFYAFHSFGIVKGFNEHFSG